LQSGRYSARSEVSFPPFKTQIRPKIKKIVSEGLFAVFTVQNRVPRPESVQVKTLKQLFYFSCELFQRPTLHIFLPVPADPSTTVSPQVRHLLQPCNASGRRSIVAFNQILGLSSHIHRYGCSLLVISNFWPRHALPMKLYTTVLSNFKTVDPHGTSAVHKIDISVLYL